MIFARLPCYQKYNLELKRKLVCIQKQNSDLHLIGILPYQIAHGLRLIAGKPDKHLLLVSSYCGWLYLFPLFLLSSLPWKT